MTANGLHAKVFEGGVIPGAWRVEGKDGGHEVFAIFAGPDARQNAVDYARQLFGRWEEITLERDR
jgi:hypothetical protein